MVDTYRLGNHAVPKPASRLAHRQYAQYRYPKGVLGVYDNGGKTADRYTVLYGPTQRRTQGRFRVQLYACRHSSDDGTIGYRGECAKGLHLGRRIAFEALPEACREAVARDLSQGNTK
jgi:hypothetical protein